MLYHNDEMLPTLSIQSSQRSIHVLLNKLLSLRRLEYVVIDRELKIQETSLKVQQFADNPDQVAQGKDVRAGFPELIGIEEILTNIIEERVQSFQLKASTRVLEDGSYLYFDLYIFGYKELQRIENLVLFCENVTSSVAERQSILQAANENSIIANSLATAHDYIYKIINSISDALLVTTASGKIKKVNLATEILFGYSADELINKSLSTITADAELLRQFSQLPPAIKSEYWHQIKVVCHTKKGLKLTLAFSCSTMDTSIKSKQADSYVAQDLVYIGRDITKEQRLKNSQKAQYAVTTILSESTSLDNITQKILQAICESLEWDVGELWTPVTNDKEARFYPEKRSEKHESFSALEFCYPVAETPALRRVGFWQGIAEVGNFLESGEQIIFASGVGLPGAVWQSGSPQWITDIVKDSKFVRSHLAKQVGLHSAFAFPIHASGQVVGVMTFFCQEQLPPDRDLLQIMATIGSQLGEFIRRKYAEKELQEAEASIRILYEQEKRQSEELAQNNLDLEQAKLELETANRELQRIASVDGLTKIANRRCFDKTMESEWRRLAREKQPLSLILCDIDFFKLYNDTYGHQGGDECLKAVAEILARNARRGGDVAARYGGEEFAVILPQTDARGAMQVAEFIRTDLKAAGIFHAASKVSEFVTLSIGVANAVPAAGLSIEGLIGEADRALYRAKLEGRDRIVCLDSKREFQGGKGVFSDDCERS
ncbi:MULTISPECIES: diguanylate cyclase domain-containing protein [unclassified Microcoleus]|uniref:diguanylate cyclase domain-containing protein n=1 Tax=unclassified Microcoleus TaxID=2642155 RepID=UPI002FD22323